MCAVTPRSTRFRVSGRDSAIATRSINERPSRPYSRVIQYEHVRLFPEQQEDCRSEGGGGGSSDEREIRLLYSALAAERDNRNANGRRKIAVGVLADFEDRGSERAARRVRVRARRSLARRPSERDTTKRVRFRRTAENAYDPKRRRADSASAGPRTDRTPFRPNCGLRGWAAGRDGRYRYPSIQCGRVRAAT